jgi:hypothetical protein
MNTKDITARHAREARLSFLHSLFQRVLLDGITLVAGESYTYLGRYSVEEAAATQEDIDTVMREVEHARKPA